MLDQPATGTERPEIYPEAAAAESRRDALRLKGVALQRSGRLDEAISVYRELLGPFAEDDPGIWTNLAAALRQKRNFEAAAAACSRAISLRPGDPALLSNRANVLKDMNRLPESINLHERAVKLEPQNPMVLHNFSTALRDAGEFERALKYCNAACELAPENAGYQLDRAMLHLYLGHAEDGWRTFEWRWRTGELNELLPEIPFWRGEDLVGKDVVVFPEQGFGDTIFATRYLPLLKARGARVRLVCKQPLYRLFSGLEGCDELLPFGGEAPLADFKCPMMSLPGLLNPSLTDGPPPVKLNIPEAAVRKARTALGPRRNERLRVGIVWSGSLSFKNNANRAVSLRQFLPLAEQFGVQFYSLQKGPRSTDLREFGAEPLVIDLDPYINDFADTAAFIRALDLVIMTDSSVAHLCGSLNAPVWNLIQFVPYWLYGGDETTTPWYPSMKLFRQKRPGDWEPVFERVFNELSKCGQEFF